MVAETVQWMVGCLVSRGVDMEKVAIRGYQRMEDNSIVLTAHERLGQSSRYRPVPDRRLGAGVISHRWLIGDAPAEGAQAIETLERAVGSGFIDPPEAPVRP